MLWLQNDLKAEFNCSSAVWGSQPPVVYPLFEHWVTTGRWPWWVMQCGVLSLVCVWVGLRRACNQERMAQVTNATFLIRLLCVAKMVGVLFFRTRSWTRVRPPWRRVLPHRWGPAAGLLGLEGSLYLIGVRSQGHTVGKESNSANSLNVWSGFPREKQNQ